MALSRFTHHIISTIDQRQNLSTILSNKILKKEQNINKLSEKVGELTYKKQELITKIQNWQKDKILAKQELDELSRKINEFTKILNNFKKQKESLDNENKTIRRENKNNGLEIDKLITEQNQLIKKISLE